MLPCRYASSARPETERAPAAHRLVAGRHRGIPRRHRHRRRSRVDVRHRPGVARPLTENLPARRRVGHKHHHRPGRVTARARTVVHRELVTGAAAVAGLHDQLGLARALLRPKPDVVPTGVQLHDRRIRPVARDPRTHVHAHHLARAHRSPEQTDLPILQGRVGHGQRRFRPVVVTASIHPQRATPQIPVLLQPQRRPFHAS